MLRQTVNRFENTKHPSILLKRVEAMPTPTKIITIDLLNDQTLDNNVLEYVKFKVDETGYYNVSNQLCIKHTDVKATQCNFLQFGLCEGTSKNYDQNFNSIIINSLCEPDYLISNNLSTVLELKSEVEYICWLNFASDNNNNFQFNKAYSHLILYKL